jgi:uncharacterized protein (DUF697 family)
MTEREAMDREAQAEAIVKRYAAYSAVGGLMPGPLLDMAAVTVLELKMLSEMAKVYGVPFSHDRGKAILSALLGGTGAAGFAYGFGGRLLAAVPLVGPAIMLMSGPLFGYAATWAVGRVFIQHFASGGTLLDFNPEEVRSYFRQQFDEAKGSSAPSSVA